jgi:crossover junction endodeoxyribonuclease RusA
MKLQSPKKKVEFTLPWPPSINNYYGRNKKKVYLKPSVRKYFETAIFEMFIQTGKPDKFYGKLKVLRDIYPPDKRRRDEDNIVKALNDVLMRANLIVDDSQIIKAANVKHKPKKPGYIKITLEEI